MVAILKIFYAIIKSVKCLKTVTKKGPDYGYNSTFAALRPKEEYVEKVISPPYDVIDRKEALKLAAGNHISFLHVCRSEIDLPHIEDPYHPEVYKQARLKLEDFISQGILIRDDRPCFYIYQLTMDGRVQTGIAACASIDEYINGDIKNTSLLVWKKN